MAGRHTAGTVTLVDIFPTLMDYCGLAEPRQGIEGLNMGPLLENPGTAWERPAFTIYEEGYFSARDGPYRLIQYPAGTEELYDHQSDPHEFTNIADRSESTAIKQRLRKCKPAGWAKSPGGRKG